MFRKIMLTATLAYVALLSGCASVPMASQELDAKAKTYAVAPGKANIYVYRNENFGAAVKLNVEMDGKVVGQTAAKTYFALEVEPGPHTITTRAENVSSVDLVAEVGKNYFVWQEVKMGMFAPRSQMQVMDETGGRAGVGECKLIDIAAK